MPADYIDVLTEIESKNAGGYTARNPKSGAYGRYQFLPSTWRHIMGNAPMTPENQDKAFKKFSEGNDSYFRGRIGRDPTNSERYLMHQQGAAGAVNLLNARPEAKLGKNQLSNNPGKAKNVGEWLDNWRAKYDNIAMRNDLQPLQEQASGVDVNMTAPIKADAGEEQNPVNEMISPVAPIPIRGIKNPEEKLPEQIAEETAIAEAPQKGFFARLLGNYLKG